MPEITRKLRTVRSLYMSCSRKPAAASRTQPTTPASKAKRSNKIMPHPRPPEFQRCSPTVLLLLPQTNHHRPVNLPRRYHNSTGPRRNDTDQQTYKTVCVCIYRLGGGVLCPQFIPGIIGSGWTMDSGCKVQGAIANHCPHPYRLN